MKWPRIEAAVFGAAEIWMKWPRIEAAVFGAGRNLHMENTKNSFRLREGK
jgi:hypothetical protein